MVLKLLRNKEQIGSEQFDKQYDSLYENIDLQRNFYSITYNIIFLVRRIVLSVIIVCLSEQSFLQIQAQVFSNFFVLYYLIKHNPLKEIAA